MTDLIALCVANNPNISHLSISSDLLGTFWQQLSVFNSCLSWGY
ncbi:hypothetical protein [Suttonella ornithocola]|uniref:Uncharacterized protein n=1 Tax=Suttonella ornithocola TaxID=279832 RepID=A0A380MWB6_9GAMM|nr:hypothetical protein [Suttonella ornithocola]SUO96346.1 Uncharacterised protein [Suttonella ornithocola]